ncbi:MAG TPA: 50S ribosomal protein L33 [Candidatus Omnitrophica bacterium]|nr:50S ribosomal protein L33 [Candidatus Omnitrophota bacterium]
MVLRETVSLRRYPACATVSSRRNYYITKNKRKHPEKFVINKFCRFCRKHIPHKETKP